MFLLQSEVQNLPTSIPVLLSWELQLHATIEAILAGIASYYETSIRLLRRERCPILTSAVF